MVWRSLQLFEKVNGNCERYHLLGMKIRHDGVTGRVASRVEKSANSVIAIRLLQTFWQLELVHFLRKSNC